MTVIYGSPGGCNQEFQLNPTVRSSVVKYERSGNQPRGDATELYRKYRISFLSGEAELYCLPFKSFDEKQASTYPSALAKRFKIWLTFEIFPAMTVLDFVQL